MFLLYQKLGVSALIGSWVCIFIVSFMQYAIFKAISKNSKLAAVRKNFFELAPLVNTNLSDPHR